MYYLGMFDPDCNRFRKTIEKNVWEKIKSRFNIERREPKRDLRYYSLDRCFIFYPKTGDVFTEKYGSPELINNNILLVDIERVQLPFFPCQFSYFNRQEYITWECSEDNIQFSEYIENGTSYYEISSPDKDKILQLSSSVSTLSSSSR